MRDTHDSGPEKFPTTWDGILSLAKTWSREDSQAFYKHILDAIDQIYSSTTLNKDRPATSAIQSEYAIVALSQALAIVKNNIPVKDKSATAMILRETMQLMTSALGVRMSISTIGEKWESPEPGASFPIGNIRKQIEQLLQNR